MNKDFILSNLRTVQDFPIKGINFFDITTLALNPEAYSQILDALYEMYKSKGITKVLGIEARGYLFGPALANRLGVGFVMVRKPGKLPAKVYEVKYFKEYGEDRLQIHQDSVSPDDVVLIHDDILATGGSMEAVVRLVKSLGVKKYYANAIIEIEGLGGREKLHDVEVDCLLELSE